MCNSEASAGPCIFKAEQDGHKIMHTIEMMAINANNSKFCIYHTTTTPRGWGMKCLSLFLLGSILQIANKTMWTQVTKMRRLAWIKWVDYISRKNYIIFPKVTQFYKVK